MTTPARPSLIGMHPIAKDQKVRGWPDMDPESICHECGGGEKATGASISWEMRPWGESGQYAAVAPDGPCTNHCCEDQ